MITEIKFDKEIITGEQTISNKFNEYFINSDGDNSLEYTGFFLKTIINDSLEMGIVPDKWKLSTVIPIQKVKNTKNAEEFRPINTLPPDEKIMEKFVKNQLVNYIKDANILVKQQSEKRILKMTM